MEPLQGVESTTQWLQTSTNPKTVSPFTLHLQQDQASVIGNLKIDIAQIEKGNETWSVNITEPSSSFSDPCLGVVFSKYQNQEPHHRCQQLSMEEEIDVFSVVRLLQTRRPELCSTLEEYEIIHSALRSFIQSQIGENVYYNH
uniref:Uncharacterized protein n=1 Tax=Magallana gigas TaxID=29159 RepID=A0A8W8MNC3_MAGGI